MAELIQLHIGGKESKEGWKILNALPGANVDFIGDIRDLSQFKDACCRSIYASHVLEHVGQCDMLSTLKGLRRLLIPKGELMISVPDLDTLCTLFMNKELPLQSRYHVMRMMFGGQIDDFDFHYIGLNLEILLNYLEPAGFASAKRVQNFGLFNDTSSYEPYGVPISLNVIAYNF